MQSVLYVETFVSCGATLLLDSSHIFDALRHIHDVNEKDSNKQATCALHYSYRRDRTTSPASSTAGSRSRIYNGTTCTDSSHCHNRSSPVLTAFCRNSISGHHSPCPLPAALPPPRTPPHSPCRFASDARLPLRTGHNGNRKHKPSWAS